jgi:hypothetical protein
LWSKLPLFTEGLCILWTMRLSLIIAWFDPLIAVHIALRDLASSEAHVSVRCMIARRGTSHGLPAM